MNKLTIYTIPVSLYCAKLRILLRHKRLDWQELAPPGGYGSDEYAQIVPSGSLPAMIDGDLLLSDSEAIAEYLNEKYPHPPLLPVTIVSRAKIRELSRYHDTRLEPEIRALFAHIAPDKRDCDFVSNQVGKITIRLKELSQLLAISVAGGTKNFDEQLSLGDCGFAISFVWIEQLSQAMGCKVEWPERVLEYKNHIHRFAAVSDELADYQPKLVAWLDAATNSNNIASESTS